jgi:predicted 3-demethylubiquinone-9 3-methyltransferase (glyoxalase superfamily)
MSTTIHPFLWFDGNAEEAVTFYTSVFADSRVLASTRYGDAGPGPKGAVMTMQFELNGQKITALNGGPQFRFTPAISLVATVDTQAEVDELWEKLSAGGAKGQCGWLTDRFGLSWQVVPRELPALLATPDPIASQRVMKALMAMTKLDVDALRRARDGA